jgi:hypothetical protein
LAVYGIDDPVVEGVACHYTAPEKGGLAGAFGLAENSTKQDGGRTFWETAHHRFLHELGGKRFTGVGGWGSPHGIGAF